MDFNLMFFLDCVCNSNIYKSKIMVTKSGVSALSTLKSDGDILEIYKTTYKSHLFNVVTSRLYVLLFK